MRRTDADCAGWVFVLGLTAAQVHGHFADVTIGSKGTNVDFGGTDLKVMGKGGAAYPAGACEGKFVPMQ